MMGSSWFSAREEHSSDVHLRYSNSLRAREGGVCAMSLEKLSQQITWAYTGSYSMFDEAQQREKTFSVLIPNRIQG
jgi:hypothetical protein